MANDVTDSQNTLTSLQLQRVDKAFEELFGYKWGTTFALTECSDMTKPTVRLLCDILGPTAAARVLNKSQSTREKSNQFFGTPSLVASVKVVAHKKRQHYKASLQSSTAGAVQSSGSETLPVVGLPAASVTAATSKQQQNALATGIDSLLNELNGSNKISTVAKTAADWDQFKEQTGLGGQLEEQVDSSTAYLKKQDFLTRVDQRTFELEKKERDRDRIKRG